MAGTIYERKLKEGGITFQAVFRLRKRGLDPIYETASFATEKEAKKWLEKTKAKFALGLLSTKTEAKRTTFFEAVERYKAEILPSKRGHLQDGYKLNTILKTFPSNKFLSDISPADISTYKNNRLKNASGTTVAHELALISHVFNIAIKEWGFVELLNPVAKIKKPQFNRSRDRRLLDGEIEAILAHTESSFLGPVVALALETAMRQSEIAGMTWDMVDLKKRTVTLPETKNGEKRIVPLSPTAFSLISEFPRPLQGGKIFSVESHSISTAFAKAVKRARKRYEKECTEKKEKVNNLFLTNLHFHDLRHEATSRLFEKGFSVAEVSAITGHKTLEMLKRYTHISPSHLVSRLAETESI